MAWAPAYASTSELASLVRIGDTADDAQLALALEAASRAIDHTTGRQFGLLAAVEARYYAARWDSSTYRWAVEIDDLMTTTGLIVKVDSLDDATYPDTVTASYVRRWPVNAAAKGRPWTRLAIHQDSNVQPTGLEAGVEVTARWGWTSVPATVKQACLMQASRLLARRDSPFGVAGSPEVGSEMRLLARLDPDVAVAVAPYRRWWGAV
jgi:hypothetical protein